MKQEMMIQKGKPYPLGMTVTGRNEVNLAAVLQTKKECGVILYPKNGNEPIRLPFDAKYQAGSVYCMKITGIRPADYEYNLFAGDEIITDPYARKINGNEKWGQKISPELRGAVCPEAFDWEDDSQLQTPLCDSILYLLHVRGFTRHASSKVAHKGTFLGVAEKIPYLKELGITAVELMPAYEFIELEKNKRSQVSMQEALQHYKEKNQEEEQPRINYWGYKKGCYFAPKASYAAGKNPSAEFKSMVKSLHENGLEVIMQFYFPKDIKKGFILEVLKYWVYEYHIDGIHLMGEQIPTALIASDPMLSKTKLFYYDFPCQEIYKADEKIEYKNLAGYRDDFLYDMRKFLKGDEDTLAKALYQMRKNPEQMGSINYIANYEGFSLADMVAYDQKHNEANGEENRDGNPYNASWNCGAEGKTRKKNILSLRTQQMKNAVLLLLFSQATPMLVAGDEFGQSREGNNNPYCQDNEISWLNWKNAEKNQEFLGFVKEAVALRRAHPILHKPDELLMSDYIACGCPELSYHGQEAWKLEADRMSRSAGVMYCGNYAKIDRTKNDFSFYFACNMHWEAAELALPPLPAGLCWEKIMETVSDEKTASVSERMISLPGRCIQIWKSKEDTAPGVQEDVKEGNKIEGITAF